MAYPEQPGAREDWRAGRIPSAGRGSDLFVGAVGLGCIAAGWGLGSIGAGRRRIGGGVGAQLPSGDEPRCDGWRLCEPAAPRVGASRVRWESSGARTSRPIPSTWKPSNSSYRHELVAWQQAGLLTTSVVTGIIRTIKQGMIVKKMGVLGPADLNAVEDKLRESLAL
jgi:hypothetical protein